MTTFKVGDWVRVTNTRFSTDSSAGIKVGGIYEVVGTQGAVLIKTPKYSGYYMALDQIELVERESKLPTTEVHFILQYELDQDPFEAFATMKEVEARIKELSLHTDLKRESIKVYEVAKTYDVSLETRVVFNGLLGPKVKLSETTKPKAKRGRPVGSKTRKSSRRSKAMKAAWARRKAAASAS